MLCSAETKLNKCNNVQFWNKITQFIFPHSFSIIPGLVDRSQLKKTPVQNEADPVYYAIKLTQRGKLGCLLNRRNTNITYLIAGKN